MGKICKEAGCREYELYCVPSPTTLEQPTIEDSLEPHWEVVHYQLSNYRDRKYDSLVSDDRQTNNQRGTVGRTFALDPS
jgi:hypothetical protein